MSLVGDKSKAFAVRIVRLYQYLQQEKKEFVLSKQLLRSGTSIGANIAEAEYAISRNEFQAKLYISLKETAETLYWLELLLPDGLPDSAAIRQSSSRCGRTAQAAFLLYKNDQRNSQLLTSHS